jgi:S-adenosylmethionine synthetase
VDQPQVAAVQVALDGRTKLMEIQTPIRRILVRGLERIPDFCESLARGEYSIC